MTFTATPTNGGTTPIYQWKKNGTNIGTNSATYTASNLTNADIISCILTSNATCANPTTATSTAINMGVNPVLVPTISIAASATAICAGTSVTFTATSTNGGTTPIYQWKKNGTNIGTNSTTYTANNLADADIITCVLTSNATCASPTTTTSTAINMVVNPVLVPTISIAASATTICAGTSVSFTATPTNGGTTPTYQWKKNGTNIGTNNATYTASNLADADIITCVLTSTAICANPATSTAINMVVNPVLVPTISITASATTICAGTSVTFTATPTNGGTTPIYQWKKNGTNIGTNSTTYTASNLANADIITCVLVSDGDCVDQNPVNSNDITIIVNDLLIPIIQVMANPSATINEGAIITFTTQVTNGGNNPIYQWLKNNQVIQSANSDNYIATAGTDVMNGDVISVKLFSNENCIDPDSAMSNQLSLQIASVGISLVDPKIN